MELESLYLMFLDIYYTDIDNDNIQKSLQIKTNRSEITRKKLQVSQKFHYQIKVLVTIYRGLIHKVT